MLIPQRFFNYLLACTFFLFAWSCSAQNVKDPAVLVFSKTQGFTHNSIPAGNKALIKLGDQNGFEVDTTQNAAAFSDENLKNYAAVIFLNTTGDILNQTEQAAFKRFIQGGGNFVGVHAAADTEHDWEWYGGLVGAYFNDHPQIQEADLIVRNTEHPATNMLPEKWTKVDEWYNFKAIKEGIQVLITIDENSYEGGGNGEWHPMSWFREYDGGRSFYTGLGHDQETYQNALFLEHLLGGISYAIYGDGELLKENE